MLWHCWMGVRKSIRSVKNWVMMCWCDYLSGANSVMQCKVGIGRGWFRQNSLVYLLYIVYEMLFSRRAWSRMPCTATSCLKRQASVWSPAAALDRGRELIISGQYSFLYRRTSCFLWFSRWGPRLCFRIVIGLRIWYAWAEAFLTLTSRCYF